jgi:hypothetical protein
MAFGEQAALCGILASLKPQLALELGTFRGGSLAHIAAYSREVHSFDLASHVVETLPNVSYHLGDTATTLPRLLAELTEQRRNVSFALVDADHSREGVERDLDNLLRSPAVTETMILLHDCANEAVREGARLAIMRADGIAYADLSFLDTASHSSLLNEAWGGLGIVVVDSQGEFWPLHRKVLANVHWRTSGRRSLAWHALSPIRSAKRDLLYRARPFYRKLAGTRGVRLS